MENPVEAYLASTAAGQRDAAEWRISCYGAGCSLADVVEREWFPLAGKDVLDLAAGWGGHILAFAQRGSRAVAAELNDHKFGELSRFAASHQLDLRAVIANCEALPLEPESFDVVLGLELIEHIDSVPAFARDVARVLKPGGIAILSTPARFKCFFDGEPHFHLRFLTILPFRLQAIVARRLFKRGYPFPITRQYLFGSSALRPFRDAGLEGAIVWTGRLAERLGDAPVLGRLGRELLFSYLIVKRPVA